MCFRQSCRGESGVREAGQAETEEGAGQRGLSLAAGVTWGFRGSAGEEKRCWGHVPAIPLPFRVSRGALQGAPPPRPGFLHKGGGWRSLEGKTATLAGFPHPSPAGPHRTHHPCIQSLANTLTPRPHQQRLCFNEAQFGPSLRIPPKSPEVILTCCQYCQDTFLEVPDISTFQTLYFPSI